MAQETRPGTGMSDESDGALRAHVTALGLGTVEEYVAWCARHGFSRRTAKNARQRLKERAFATRAAADARLARNRDELRNPRKAIEAIFRGQLDEGEVTQPHLKAVCRASKAAQSCDRTRQAFLDLLLHAVRHADLFAIHPVIPDRKSTRLNS